MFVLHCGSSAMRYLSKSLRHFYQLLISMTSKELRARYKHTFFGFFWLLVNPLLQMSVMAFVFRFFIKEEIIHYPYLLFLGLLIWNFFSLSLSKATPSIVYERALIKKARFPREVIPLSIVLSNFINTGLALGLLFIPVLFLGTLQISSFFYLLVALLLLFLLTSGLSLLTSALNVMFRDINFFVQAFLIVWFYATPIVYPLSFVPNQYQWLWFFNPLTSILQLAQYACLHTPLPNWQTFTSNLAVIVLVATLGILVFKKQATKFDDWL